MKKLLLAAGAALGIYMIVKKLNAKKQDDFIGNKSAADVITKGGIIADGGRTGNGFSDETNLINHEINTADKVILADGGNEDGGTGGSIKNSIGDSV